MNLIALTSLGYGGRRLQPGDLFHAGERDARTLVLIGKARLADEPTRRGRYRRRDMQAES